MGAERPWEKSYPPGVRWDAPIETATLPALFDVFTATWGPKPALEYRDRKTSYTELRARVEAAASGLMDLGVGPGTSVALYLPNTPYHPLSFFAVLKAGGRLVHLSPLDAERELAHKLADSGARILVTTNVGFMLLLAQKLQRDGLVDHLIVGDDTAFGPSAIPTTPIADGPGLVRFDKLTADGAKRLPRQWPAVDVEDVALLQYTGGTTGKPKGAMLSHANLSAACSMYKLWTDPQRLSSPGEDRVICVLPLFHIFALTSVMLRSLYEGNELLLRARFDVATTLDDIEVKKATVFCGVPTMWIALANTPNIDKRDFSSLRYAASGGAALPVEVAERFQKLTGHRLGGGWGMTETSPAGTALPKDCAHKPGSVGLPLPGILIDIVALDDPRRRLAPGEKGEIRIKGPNVTKGYWRAPAETAAAFADGYLLTGDIGYMDEDGYFYLVDRKKDMIISGGFNVYPRTIEEAIYEHPAVAEVIVIGVRDAYRGEAAKAFVQLKVGAGRFTLDELRAFLADRLGRYEMPAHLEFRDALPKTAVGKLSKKELIAEERQKMQAAAE
ncbi:MAG: dicarboxylate--CoA ligase PimA [Alphaproteobacteria bacterium]|nr:MAG: dicarboxylate--CoA ligase PimA [Alphaproteobacteria bacterium]